MKVSGNFATYLRKIQKETELATGRRMSIRDITAVMGATRPVIKVEVSKRRHGFSILDL